MDGPVRFEDVVNLWVHIAFLGGAVLLGLLVGWRLRLEAEHKDKMISILIGLIAAQGILVSFSLAAGESLTAEITRLGPQFFGHNLRTIGRFYDLMAWLSYAGVFGILVMTVAALSFVYRLHHLAHRLLVSLSVALFLFQCISLVRTYQVIHNLRLLDLTRRVGGT
jgi:hypothetical protein